MATSALYACTKCNQRYPFEELSQGQQLCKVCWGGEVYVCVVPQVRCSINPTTIFNNKPLCLSSSQQEAS